MQSIIIESFFKKCYIYIYYIHRDSSVMTSMEIVSPITRPQLQLRQSVQGRYLIGLDSEYDLFERVSRKMAGRRSQEVNLYIYFYIFILLTLILYIVCSIFLPFFY